MFTYLITKDKAKFADIINDMKVQADAEDKSRPKDEKYCKTMKKA